MDRKPSWVDTGCGCGEGVPVGLVGWGGSSAMRSRIWTCQPVTRTSSMSRRRRCCFWGVVEVVDDGVNVGGEIVHAAAELVITGELGSFVGEAGSLVLQLFSACG